MSKIKNYGLDSLLTGTDKLIGSDSDSNGTTKNYSINSISDYIYTDLDIGSIENKLAGIESGAQVNTVDSVNTQTGDVVLDADDIDDATTNNKFTSQSDIDRLANTSGTNTGDQDLSNYVDKTNNQTIGGLKIFTQDVTMSQDLSVGSQIEVGSLSNSQNPAIYAKTSNTSENILLESSDIGAGSAPDLVLYRNAGIPEDQDTLGVLEFKTNNINGNSSFVWNGIYSRVIDASLQQSALTLTAFHGSSSVVGLGVHSTSPSQGSVIVNSPSEFATPNYTLDVRGDIGVTSNVTIDGGIYADNSLGTSGQILSSTGTGIEWVNSAGGGAGLEGTQYIYVQANGTDTENATELQSAYNTAKTMSPSATNRITVICGNGNYNFSSDFVINEQYVDLVSLDGNRSVIFNGTGTISITANDVFIKGVDVVDKNFTIGDSLNLLKVENCKGGDYSFGYYVTVSGTFIYDVTVSGTFTNCEGGNDSFGRSGTASGTFRDCVGGVRSFTYDGTASGTFTDCKGGDFSFAYLGTASGTFTDCVGDTRSFAYDGTASGTFTDCKGGAFSFGRNGTASGTFTNCEGGDYSFGRNGTASGTFTNCQGGEDSFGRFGTLNGKLYYCRLTTGTFETVSSGGLTRLCIDGNNNENNQG